MGPNTFVTSVGSSYGQKRGLSKKFIIFVAVGLIVVIGLVITIVSLAGRDNLGSESQHLSAQLNNLTTLTASAKLHLQDGNEQKINAETEIIADGVQANLATTLPKKVDKSIASDESDTATTAKLSSAAIDGTYDSEYKGVLQQKLEALTALLSAMYNKTKSASLKSNLNQSYTELNAVLANLNKLS